MMKNQVDPLLLPRELVRQLHNLELNLMDEMQKASWN